ncbi:MULTISPECIES: hypothetical protein [unclassified Roseivivax]|uniref:hypothetical protein n=1 Tax=unclassified Roseivivax TaxID=2639302 RepID=UPI0012695897|nr:MULTISPECIES: hypothetical protein [unclassified Roseivivax]
MMFVSFLYRNSGLSRMHSLDLEDMKQAISEEDHDGPDGGSPHADRQRPDRHRRTKSGPH